MQTHILSPVSIAPAGSSDGERRRRLTRANETWETLLSAQVALMRRFAADPVWDPLSMREYDILYTLSKVAGGLRISGLNEGVLLSQPALSRLLDRMESQKLISRAPDPTDKRAVLVHATDSGKAAQRRVGAKHALSVSAAVSNRLSDAEMDTLIELCQRLAAPPGNHDRGAD